MKKLSVLFVYDLPPENEVFWRDGLYEALKILEKQSLPKTIKKLETLSNLL